MSHLHSRSKEPSVTIGQRMEGSWGKSLKQRQYGYKSGLQVIEMIQVRDRHRKERIEKILHFLVLF